MADRKKKTTTKSNRGKRKLPLNEEVDDTFLEDQACVKISKTEVAEKNASEKQNGVKSQMRKKEKILTFTHSPSRERGKESSREIWNTGEIYDPMRRYMNEIKLPPETTTSERETEQKVNVVESGDILSHNVIILYVDCVHKLSKSVESSIVRKTFPEAGKEENSTPFNDRRKLGHLSWFLQNGHLVVHLYVAFKWKRSVNSSSDLNYEALNLAVERLSYLVKDQLVLNKRPATSLSVGTHLPHGIDQDRFLTVFQEKFDLPITIMKNSREETSSETLQEICVLSKDKDCKFKLCCTKVQSIKWIQ